MISNSKRDTATLRVTALVLAVIIVGGVVAPLAVSAADGPPSPPHRFFGTVTDDGGDRVADVTVEAVYNGTVIDNTTTNGDGNYDFQVEDPDDDASGESLTLRVPSMDYAKSMTWSSAGSSEVNFGPEAETTTTTTSDTSTTTSTSEPTSTTTSTPEPITSTTTSTSEPDTTTTTSAPDTSTTMSDDGDDDSGGGGFPVDPPDEGDDTTTAEPTPEPTTSETTPEPTTSETTPEPTTSETPEPTTSETPEPTTSETPEPTTSETEPTTSSGLDLDPDEETTTDETTSGTGSGPIPGFTTGAALLAMLAATLLALRRP